MKAGTTLFAAVAVGLIVGGAAGYFGGRAVGGTTVTSTNVVVSTTSVTATNQTSGVNLQAALDNTVAPDLVVTSYSFGKGTLTAFLLNNGTEPFVITSHVPFINGSTDTVASVFSLDSKVLRIGSYLYVPPGSTIVVSVDAPTFLAGQKGILTIYGDQWTFVYGTQKD